MVYLMVSNQIFLFELSSSLSTLILSKSVLSIFKNSFKLIDRLLIISFILKSPLQDPTLICSDGYLLGKKTLSFSSNFNFPPD